MVRYEAEGLLRGFRGRECSGIRQVVMRHPSVTEADCHEISENDMPLSHTERWERGRLVGAGEAQCFLASPLWVLPSVNPVYQDLRPALARVCAEYPASF